MNDQTTESTTPALAQHDSLPAIFGGSMSPAIQIMLDDRLFERAKLIAKYMSAAEGFVPGHLIGKTEACFAVVMRSLTWKLDPFAVAQSTYSPAPGKVGFEGKLCQAIIENSGKVKGGVEYEEYGDWLKVHGKFNMIKNDKGKKYPVATYTDEDERGLGVIARAHVTGERKPREFKIDLRQAQPRNSTLWATDPLMQLKYRAARGLGNLAMPGIFMGVLFEREDFLDPADNAVDVTPSAAKNIKDELTKEAEKEKAKTVDIDPSTGEVIEARSAMAKDEPTLQDWLDDIANAPTAAGVDHKYGQATDHFLTDHGAMAAITLARTQRKQALAQATKAEPKPEVAAGSRKLFEKSDKPEGAAA